MNYDKVLNGIRIGEYDFIPNGVIDEIKKKCIDQGMNYVAFSVGSKAKPTASDFEEWAAFLRDNKIYFTFTRSPQTSIGFDRETALKMKETAGEYYLGNIVTEIGSAYCCKGSEYGGTGEEALEKSVECMTDGKQVLVDAVKHYLKETSFDGAIPSTVIEATGLLPYVADCCNLFPLLETMCGNPEIMLPMLRGTAKAQGSKMFATYIAHEWYAGTRKFDALKRKRLKTVYDYAYMQGSGLFVLESGDIVLHSHDACNYQSRTVDDTAICENYRNVIKDFASLVREDKRPSGGPRVDFAFVQGNLDGYSPWRGGSSLWNQWEKKEFGYGAPEFAWRLFDDISAKRAWGDVHNFGEYDLSNAPAYGTYDIIPATASAETMSKYGYLVFTGWNTMTDEIYENLKKYVMGGGVLIMCAAHLNTSDRRDGTCKLIKNGSVSDLFGCELSAESSFSVNDGYRFNESIIPNVLYPVSRDFDPLFSEGYVNYARATLRGGKCSAMLTQDFCFKESDLSKPAIIENKLGEGHSVLFTSLDYPSGAPYSVYRTIVREFMQASHRAADIKVLSGDKVRFTVYDKNKVYLLNTDFDCKSHVKIITEDKTVELLLEPCELKTVEC